jgi:hypothetical protein
MAATSRFGADAGEFAAEVDVEIVIHDVIDFSNHNLERGVSVINLYATILMQVRE